MPKKHISVWKAVFLWLIAVVMILLGLFSMIGGIISGSESGVSSGLGLMILGFIVASINKLVFRVRTKQLEIDTKEAIRDKIGYVCPNCGRRVPEGSKFCNNCGYKMK